MDPAKWPYDPRYENSVAVLAGTLFCTGAMISFGYGVLVETCLQWIILLLFLFIFLFRFVFLPLWVSSELQPNHPAWRIRSGEIFLRRSDQLPTMALDLVVKRYIIFNEDDLHHDGEKWRILYHHEFAHISNGDSRFFNFVIAAAHILSSQFVFWFAYLTVDLLNPEFDEQLNTTPDVIVMIVSLFALQPLYFFTWLRKGLHRREFNADAFGALQERAAYLSWLRASTRRQALPPTKLSAGFLAPLYSRIREMTHPTWKDRLQRVEENTGRESIVEKETAFNFIALCIPSGVFAAFSWVGTGLYADATMDQWLWNLTFFLLLFPAIYLSMSMFRFLERYGVKGAISLSLYTGGASVFIYISFYMSNVLTGDATGLSETVKGAATIFAFIFSMGLMLTLGVFLINRYVVHSWQLFFALHAVNAWFAFFGWRYALVWSLEALAARVPI